MAIPPPPPGFKTDTPPPPPGFSLDAHTNVPTPPVGFKVDPPSKAPTPPAAPAKGPTAPPSAAAGPAKQNVVDQIGEDLTDVAHERSAALVHDFTTVPGKMGPKGKREVTAGSALGRVAKTGVDALGYALGPLDAAGRTLVGRPVAAAAGAADKAMGKGSTPEQQKAVRASIGDLTSAALPLGEGAKLIAGTTKLPEASRDAARVVQNLMAPATTSKEASRSALAIRGAGARQDLEANKAAHALVQAGKTAAKLDVPQSRAVVGAIENASKGKTLANPAHQKIADDVRKVYSRYRDLTEKAVGKNTGSVPQFIDDYYTHLWKDDPSKVKAAFADGKTGFQGSGRNLKQRSIPTLEEGLQRGLTPVTENPVEMTMHYVNNMAKYLTTHEVQGTLKELNYARFARQGKAPEGWVKLDGIHTDKPGGLFVNKVTEKAQAMPDRQLYAHPDVARVYNNWISKGLERGDIGPVFAGMRKATNAMTMLKLGLSSYHLATMAHESVISDVARGFQALSRGEVKTGAKAIGGAAAAPVRTALRGRKMERELLDTKTPDALSKKVNEQFVRSGGRLKMDPVYRARGSGSFYNALEKGTFKRELSEAGKRIYGKGVSGGDRVKGALDFGANVIQSTAAPLFEKYIPMIKRGAFASHMEDFIKANPNASQEELDKAAVKVNDSIDNRFGELVQDNLFWHKQMKQGAQLLLLSPTWTIGTVREIGGGLADLVGKAPADIVKGKGLSTRAAYVAALAATDATLNSVMTYLKTGTAPKGEDAAAYRTGGKNPDGSAERALMPGYGKDVFAAIKALSDGAPGVLNEMSSKANPALGTAADYATNKDYRGLPVYRPPGVAPVEGEPSPADDILDRFMPISLGSLSAGRKAGSNIGPLEQAASVRPAPAQLQNPEKYDAQRTQRNTRAWQQRIRADAKAKAQLEKNQ